MTTLMEDHAAPPGSVSSGPPAPAVRRYQEVRAMTERLCEPLVTEDYVVQSMPDVSPT